MKKKLLSIICSIILGVNVMAAEIFIYSSDALAPILTELARQFSERTGEKITVISGPFSQWLEKAQQNADIIFASSSSMMDSFIRMMPEQLDYEDVRVLNIRRAGIIVRPNNPKRIQRFQDLTRDGMNIMIINGAGQLGLYEDMALKSGDRTVLVRLRKNIRYYAENSHEAIDRWNSDRSLDAFIIWTSWAKVLGEREAMFIPIEPQHILYRAAEAVLSKKSSNRQIAGEFIEFIQIPDVQEIWNDAGWESL